MIYLDYNSTAPLKPEALAAMQKSWETWANPNSSHQAGTAAARRLEFLRNRIKNFFNAPEYCRVYCTSGGTESNNLALNSYDLPILKSPFEHDSVYNNPKSEEIKIEKGEIDINDIKNKLEKKKYLVSIMLAQHETGWILPIKEIASVVKNMGSLIHVDASQAVGKIDIDFEDLGIDMMTISSHKIGGPIGIGGLISKPILNPLFQGGGQEDGVRSGTVAIPLIEGWVAALENSNKEHMRALKEEFLNQIDQNYILKSAYPVLPNTACLISNYPASEIASFMDLNGISISMGSACKSGSLDGMRALKAINSASDKGIRVSWGWKTTKSDINAFCAKYLEFQEKRSKYAKIL